MRRLTRLRIVLLAFAAGVLVLLVAATPTGAQTSAEQELAQKYAPYVAIKPQTAPCDGNGERFRPVPVDVVLNLDGAVLRDPQGDVVKEAPSAADLYGRPAGYYLDLPGNSTKPGCTYETWFREVAADVPTTVYAHAVAEPDAPGLLALQYWFYWPFNDWNNTHESDWEMIQLVFEAPSAEAALLVDPLEVGYSQHQGAERAAWSDEKLEKIDGHPVVHPGTGSHANYYNEAVYLGYGPSTGFGCDDTRGQTDVRQAEVILLPSQPSGPDDPYAWLAFEGRWGELHRGSFSGPTGPASKDRWLAPITWRDDAWRDSSIKVTGQEPGKGLVPQASDLFCSVASLSSSVFLLFLHMPLLVGSVLGASVAGSLFLGRRTRWMPSNSVPVDMERGVGQMFTAGMRIYKSHFLRFVAMGLLFLPLGAIASGLEAVLFRFTPIGTLVSVATRDPLVGVIAAVTTGGLATFVAAVAVYAASAAATDAINRGQVPTARAAYAEVGRAWSRLALVELRVVAVVALLTITIVGVPFALLFAVRRTVANQAVMIEGLPASDALERSRDLVKGSEVRTFIVAVVTNVAVFLAGPITGILALLIWSPSITVVNLISGLIYAILVPYAGIVISLLFYDRRRAHERRD